MKVGAAAVAHDGKFIRSVFYFGMTFTDGHDVPLLSRNPFGAPAIGVKSAFVLPRNPNPQRPVASTERFGKVRAVADQVLMHARSQQAKGAALVSATVGECAKHISSPCSAAIAHAAPFRLR